MSPGIEFTRHWPALTSWLRALIVATGLLGAECASAAQPPFVMSTSVRAPLYLENGSGYFNLLSAEIFRRLDMEFELIFLPASRALAFANDKTVDGTGPRTAAIEKKFPNLVRIPINVFQFDFMVYSRDPELSITGWDSLKPYSVGLLNGWKIVEQNTTEARLVTKATNYDQLLKLLDLGRVEVAIMDRVMAGWQLRQLGFDLHAIEPPIASKPNFIYVHKQHAGLVAEITRVLSEMQQDGSLQEIRAKTLSGQIDN